MEKRWQILRPDPQAVNRLTVQLGCHPVIAGILASRNFTTVEKATRFLKAPLSDLRNPLSLADMDAAVNRIYRAIIHRQKILIFGDYDVDGITSTALLLDFLRALDVPVSYYIPHRIREGYGLHPAQVTEQAIPQHIDLIITVDCGSGSHHAIRTARESGIDVIVTDHHEIDFPPPEACAVINPKRKDCPAGLENLAGVGVAFYLVIALRKHLREQNFWKNRPEPNLKQTCDLVALGTVADMVPNLEENRILIRAGLEVLNARSRPGVDELLRISGIHNRPVDAEDIAFRLAPRLNAAGRLEHAAIAVELLTTRDTDKARQISVTLNSLNRIRQETEQAVHEEITQNLKANPALLNRRTLVLAQEGWHEGILGIVAGRLTRKLFRPVILIAIHDGFGKGSARSIPGVNLYHALEQCRDLLDNFGGHAMAAGVKIGTPAIKTLQDRFETVVATSTPEENFIPSLTIDAVMDLPEISTGLIDALEDLMPFGPGNHVPLFMAGNVKVDQVKIIGGKHRQLTLKCPGLPGGIIKAIQFNVDPSTPRPDHFMRIAYRLQWNHWNGRKTPQIVIEET